MGIRGLFTYIQTHHKFCLNWHKLHDCTLVIDGNNLAYEIFNNSPGHNTIFGGDYDVYAHHVKCFLESLLQCNVKPYIIMDGGHPVNREKFSTLFSRMNNQTFLCIKANPKKQELLFPVFGLWVFISVVQRLGITILQADFEADDEIVVLAKHLNAYVLSNDSDFYLFDVPFILLNSVNFDRIQIGKNKEENYHFIPCYIFNSNQFCKNTGIRQEHLPILAPLLGNDFVSFSTMQRFYDKISSLRPRKKMPHRRRIIISVIKWLVKQRGSPIEILERVSRIICHRFEAKKKFLFSAFTMYFPSSSHLKRWVVSHSSSCPAFVKDQCPLLSHPPDTIPLNPLNPVPKQLQVALTCTCPVRFQSNLISGYVLPNWLLQAYRLDYVPWLVSDLLNKKYLFIHPQVEVSFKESVYAKLAPLVQIIKGLLWNMVFHSFKIQHPTPERSLLPVQNLDTLMPQRGFFSSLISNHGRVTPSYMDDLKDFFEGSYEYDNQSLAKTEKTQCSQINTHFVENSSLPSLEGLAELERTIANEKYPAFEQGSSPLPLNNDTTTTDEESPLLWEKGVAMTKRVNNSCGDYSPSDVITIESNLSEDSLVDSLFNHVLECKENESLEIHRSQEISMVTSLGLQSEDDAASDDDIQLDIATKTIDDESEGTDSNDDVSTETDSEDSMSTDNINYGVIFKDQEDFSDKAASVKDKSEKYDNLKRLKHVATVDFEIVKKTRIVPCTKWFIRKGDRMSHLNIESHRMEQYSNLPSLFTIHQLSQLERKNLFLSLLNLKGEFREKIPITLEFIFICISYWWSTYKDYVDIATLSSFLVSILMFYVIDGKLGRKPANWIESFEREKKIVYRRVSSNNFEDPSSMSIEELIEDLSLDECALANYSLYVFHTMSPRETVHSYSRQTVHAFSEYQASLLFLKSLNSLLYFPFPDVSLDSFWSGTFCYNIKRCFSLHGNLKVVLSCIFETNNRIIHLFERFYSALQSMINLPNIPKKSSFDTAALRNKLGLRRAPTLTTKRKVKKKRETLELVTDTIENPTEDDVEFMSENKFGAFLFS